MSVRRNTLEPDAMSAIVNCLCPEFGGVIELETNRLEMLEMWQALATGLVTNVPTAFFARWSSGGNSLAPSASEWVRKLPV